jgi:hypothetical protein
LPSVRFPKAALRTRSACFPRMIPLSRPARPWVVAATICSSGHELCARCRQRDRHGALSASERRSWPTHLGHTAVRRGHGVHGERAGKLSKAQDHWHRRNLRRRNAQVASRRPSRARRSRPPAADRRRSLLPPAAAARDRCDDQPHDTELTNSQTSGLTISKRTTTGQAPVPCTCPWQSVVPSSRQATLSEGARAIELSDQIASL